MKLNSFIIVLVFAAVILAAISAIPPWRQSVRAVLSSDKREILATLVTQLTSKEETYTILKIRQKEQLFVEVYKQADPHAESQFVGRINLNDRKDAFFTFRGQATNLAVSDIDQDGVQEILVPAYDQDMIARLNIFKYNLKTNSFDRMASN
ncbi:MAG: hypothetical protein AABY64_01765 [Bdellovibrionota bacterium]